MPTPREAADAAALNAWPRRAFRSGVQGLVPMAGRRRLDERALPDVLVVGAQRAGTTALHRVLAAHPRVRTAVRQKGVHFFDVRYPRGLAWYRANFPVAEPGTVVLETSPYYLFHPAVAARVAVDLPGVKVVALLRDPVERAVSHHHHEVARGYEPLGLEAALDAEDERLAGAAELLLADPFALHHGHEHHAYVGRGRYGEQLARWFDHLGRDRVLVLESTAVFDGSAAAELYAFLGLDPDLGAPLQRVNGYERDDLPTSIQARLTVRLADDAARLAELLGHRPSWVR